MPSRNAWQKLFLLSGPEELYWPSTKMVNPMSSRFKVDSLHPIRADSEGTSDVCYRISAFCPEHMPFIHCYVCLHSFPMDLLPRQQGLAPAATISAPIALRIMPVADRRPALKWSSLSRHRPAHLINMRGGWEYCSHVDGLHKRCAFLFSSLTPMSISFSRKRRRISCARSKNSEVFP